MNTIWIMEKRKIGTSNWTICFGPWLGSPDKKSAVSTAKSFQNESVGWRYRAVPYTRQQSNTTAETGKA